MFAASAFRQLDRIPNLSADRTFTGSWLLAVAVVAFYAMSANGTEPNLSTTSKPQLDSKWVATAVINAVQQSSNPSETNKNWSSGFDRARSPLTRSDLHLSSAASCAASACHGGSRPGIAVPTAIRGSEYPLWIESDPHARSWQTICSDASLKMMERLKIFADGEIVDRRAFDNCLACHNTTRLSNEPRHPELLREGIGCSGCHGPDERWRSQHFTAGWNGSAALDDGFAQTKNMLSRARVCATCHVGDKDRDMNHDIIAAGHPALHYEFSSFHQKQPKHWRETSHPASDRYESGQWLAGQLAALDASMVLLESRAGRKHTVSQWPELATYDCTSCHQPITSVANQTTNNGSASSSSLNTTGVSQWNQFGVRALLTLRASEGRSTAEDQRLSTALEDLSASLRTLAANPQQVQTAAENVRHSVDAWLKSPAGLTEVRDFNAQRLLLLVQSAARQQNSYNRWESLAQLYLASVAGRSAWPVQDRSSLVESAKQLRESLLFPVHTNSPPRYLREAPVHLQKHVHLLSPMPELVPVPTFK